MISDDLRSRTGKNGWLKMLRPFGIAVSDKKLLEWRRHEVVPAEVGFNRPTVYIAQVAAAAYLIERCGWHPSVVMHNRIGDSFWPGMEECLDGVADPLERLDWFFKAGIEGNEENYLNALNWFFTVVKFLYELPPNGGAQILARPVPGAGFAYLVEPAWTDGISDGAGRSHPREFDLPIGKYVEG